MREVLKELGIQEIETQVFKGLKSAWHFIVMASSIMLIGHLFFWFFRVLVGDIFAAVVALTFFGFSMFLMWRQFTFRDYPLKNILPHGSSQNVIAVLAPKSKVRRNCDSNTRTCHDVAETRNGIS